MRTRHFIFILLILALSFSMAACTTYKTYDKPASSGKTLVEANQNAADQLISQSNVFIDQQKPIIVTSLVNVDDVSKSSTLGRMSSEIIANRLSQQGYKVHEIKMGRDIFVIESEGELILSRDLHQIAEKHDVQGFVVGTYAVGDHVVGKTRRYLDTQALISLRYVDRDNVVAGSHNYVIENTDLEMWQ